MAFATGDPLLGASDAPPTGGGADRTGGGANGTFPPGDGAGGACKVPARAIVLTTIGDKAFVRSTTCLFPSNSVSSLGILA